MRLPPALCAACLAAALAGCAPDVADPGADSCGAGSYQGLVGSTDEAALDALADLGLAGDAPQTRFIGPGQAVTMDYRPDRLNVEYDADGIVTRVFCG